MNDESKTETHDDQELATLVGAALSARPVPDRVLLVPWGQVESTNGAFTVDDESARLVVEAFAAQGTDLPIDYEHQTLGGRYSSPSGQAPAAGWIRAVESEPGVGLFARVRWTETALEQLANAQYRYLSPVAIVRKSDRKLVGLHSAALTNKPAIAGMQPIVNRTDADDAATRDAALVALRQQLALEATSDESQVLTAAHDRIAQLEQAFQQRDANDRVAAAVQAGKLTEAQRDWATRLALRDPKLFDDWLATAPAVIVPGRTEPPGGTTPAERSAAPIETHARAEYRAHPELAALTSEEAFVADAVREMEN